MNDFIKIPIHLFSLIVRVCMELLLDGNSEIGAHVKTNLDGNSEIGIYVRTNIDGTQK